VAYAVWNRTTPTRYQVLAARRSPSGRWGRPVALSPWFSWGGGSGPLTLGGRPKIGVDDAGRATAVWSQADGGIVRVRSRTSTPRGRWSRPEWLSRKGENAFNPAVDVAGAGAAVVDWQGGKRRQKDWRLLARVRPSGGTWTPAQRLDDTVWKDSHNTESVIDDRGVATVVWDEQRQATVSGRVPVATYTPGTGWSTTTLFERSNHGHVPQLATTRGGSLVVAWADYDQVLAARRAPDGTWGPHEVVVPPRDGIGPLVRHLAINEAGLVAMSWELADLVNHANRARYLLSVSTVPGQPWETQVAGPWNRRKYLTPFASSMALDDAGGVTLTWDRQARNQRGWYDVGLSRRLPDGTWAKRRLVPGVAADVQVAADGRGRVTVLWSRGIDAFEDRCCSSLRSQVLKPG